MENCIFCRIISRQAPAKIVYEDETCMAFVSTLAAACRLSDGWIPMPRGASHNMPTGGSQDRAAASLIAGAAPGPPALPAYALETIDPEPPPEMVQPAEPPPVLNLPAFEAPLRAEAMPSHLIRNVMLVAGAVMALSVVAILGLRRERPPAESTPAVAVEAGTKAPEVQAAPPPPEVAPPPDVVPPPVQVAHVE